MRRLAGTRSTALRSGWQRRPAWRRCTVMVSIALSILGVDAMAQGSARSEVLRVEKTSLVGRFDDSDRSDARQARTKRSTHPFFDTVNIALTSVEIGALVADGITTQHLRQADPSHRFSREADPIARPFVEAGWPGQIAGGALFVTAEVGQRYLLHRKHHHRWERWLPMVLTVYGAVGAIHNARYWNDATLLRRQR
jgi:hypothetical protein